MIIEVLDDVFSVCKLKSLETIHLSDYTFIGQTPDEYSLVCPSKYVPDNTTHEDKNWAGMKIVGELDFSLVGILSKITGLLADNQIPVFAVSTYNTDYIFIKDIYKEKVIRILKENDYTIR